MILEGPGHHTVSNRHLQNIVADRRSEEAGLDVIHSHPDGGVHDSGFTTPVIEKHRLFIFSHDNESGIIRLVTDIKQYLQKNMDDDFMLDKLAYTLSMRRSRLTFRLALGGGTLNELLDAINNAIKGSIRAQRALDNPKICFAFTGK